MYVQSEEKIMENTFSTTVFQFSPSANEENKLTLSTKRSRKSAVKDALHVVTGGALLSVWANQTICTQKTLILDKHLKRAHRHW